MKRLNLRNFLLLCSCLSLSCPAQVEKPSENPIHGFVSSGPQKGYIGWRVFRNLDPDWMWWSQADLQFPYGIFANVWDSTEITRHTPDNHHGDELDTTVGWRGQIWGDMNLRLSTTVFNLYPLNKWWNGDVAVQSLWLSKDFDFGKHTLRPEARFEWISKTGDFRGGALVTIADAAHLWREPFGIKHLTLSNQSSFGRDDGFDGPKNNSRDLFYRWDGGLNWQMGKRLVLTLPSITLQIPFVNPHDGRGQREVAYGMYVKYLF